MARSLVVHKKQPDTLCDVSFSCRDSLELVFAMRSAEYQRGYNAMILRHAMPVHLEFGFMNSRGLEFGAQDSCADVIDGASAIKCCYVARGSISATVIEVVE